MCVIAAKPAGVDWLPAKNMKSCFRNNPDGAGLAWVEKGKLHVEKGYFNWKTLYHDLKALEEFPVMLHCRLATHGGIGQKNCHPFLLKNGIAMAHNGIISGIELLEKDMTDSESFGKQFIEGFPVRHLEMPHVKKLFEKALGSSNKIAMLKRDGQFIILNKSAGVMEKGIWFSNSSYEVRTGYSFMGSNITQFPPFYDYDGDYYYGRTLPNGLKQSYKQNPSWSYSECMCCGKHIKYSDIVFIEDMELCSECAKQDFFKEGVDDKDIGGLYEDDDDINDPFFASDKFMGFSEKITLPVPAQKVG